MLADELGGASEIQRGPEFTLDFAALSLVLRLAGQTGAGSGL